MTDGAPGSDAEDRTRAGGPGLRALHVMCVASLLALIGLCLAWEIWLAPLRAGGSWLVLKAVPLLLPLRGVLAGRRRTFQWASMFILAYLAEGLVRAVSDRGLSAWLAGCQAGLAIVFFACAIAYARLSRGHSPETRP